MTTQILPEVWTPGDLAAAQAKLLAQATTDDTSIQACTAASSQFKTGWNGFFAALKTFCGTSYGWVTTTNPDGSWAWGGGTGETATQIQDYATALYQWELAAQQATCTLAGPVVNPDTLPPATDALVTMVKYVSVAGAFLASAYAVGKVANEVSYFRGVGAYRAEQRDTRRALRKRRA